MIFLPTKLEGVFVIEPEKISDSRGFFARTWDKEEFEKRNLSSQLKQSSISFNFNKGTIRGLHFQESPYEETKMIRCTKGRIFDVIVDLRLDSKTKLDWYSIELSEKNHKMLYVPKGFAHGFQTLDDNCEVYYEISEKYMPEYSRGIIYNDENLKINWPLKVSEISPNDMKLKTLKQLGYN